MELTMFTRAAVACDSQQMKKGLLTLVVRTSLRVAAQLCRSRSLSSSTALARVGADDDCLHSLSLLLPGPQARDRVLMEIMLQKGQRQTCVETRLFLRP